MCNRILICPKKLRFFFLPVAIGFCEGLNVLIFGTDHYGILNLLISVITYPLNFAYRFFGITTGDSPHQLVALVAYWLCLLIGSYLYFTSGRVIIALMVLILLMAGGYGYWSNVGAYID